jgi:hypothetical protein
MGLFWDFYQQSEISSAHSRSTALEERVEWLQNELQKTQTILHEVIGRLEQHLGQDFNADGQIG